jgi:hypothetical protein
MTARRYVPWVRTGIAGAITAVDPLTGPVDARAALTVTATVNTTRDAAVPLRIYGPGDVLGFAARHVIRREPAPDTSDAEPNYFPLIEFNRPDLPWLFTPAAPNADRLRPWIVLVAVRRDQVDLDTSSGAVPVLRVADATQELPNLAESWAWAHSQVGAVADLSAVAAGPAEPGRVLSRLLCPRLLERGTRYLAAVVPAFELGRRAGLGMAVDDAAATTDPAWLPTTAAVDLPVYVWWEFVTGQEGDFQALVSRLSRIALDTVGSTGSPLSVADLPAALPDLGSWPLPGALGTCPDPLPGDPFTNRLRDLINGTATPDLVLPPPLYGRWHAAATELKGTSPGWLRRLNLDPRYRAVAAVGARIVQDHQEDLMAAAWQQAGEIEAANRLLRQGQLARSAGRVQHADLAKLPPAALLAITGALHGRVLAGPLTIERTITNSRVPAALVGAAFRRATRARGPLTRRSGSSASALLTAVNDGRLRVDRPPGRPDGTVTVDEATGAGHRRFCQLSSARLGIDGKQRHGAASARQWDEFLAAALAHQQGMPGCEPPTPTRRPALDLPTLRAVLLDATDPAKTVPQRIRARVTLPPGWQPTDPLEPVWVAPRFDTPLYRDLTELSHNYLIPSIADVPANSVTALPTNPRFVEALLVGANHEMSRELLWRGFPTDQRGTCFRRFWDRAGSLAGPGDDIGPIDAWSGDLGDHLDAGEQVVLLVRGEVLHRYPRTVLYATRARWQDGRRVPAAAPAGTTPADTAFPETYPVFSGRIPPDITFLGFDLDPDDARGDPDPTAGEPGWFFVWQQPPAEPRLGLDAPSPDATTTLSWTTVARTASDHVDLEGGLVGVAVPGWSVASTSAALAALTEQRPFRIAIHASDLLPPPVTP